MGPSDEDFEEHFEVDYYVGGTGLSHKLSYFSHAFAQAVLHRPDVVLAAHVNLSGLAHAFAKLVGGKSILNVYGAEVWSAMRRDAAWGLKNADFVISDCHNTAQYLEDKGLRPKSSIAIAWDCVDLGRFFPAQPKKATLDKYGIPDPATGVNILTLGRMSSDTAYKGYERLLNVFARVAGRLTELRLVYAGRGEMVAHLQDRAKELGLERRVFFTGMVHEDDLADIYRSGHVFSLVTEIGEGCGEGIPLTPLEAAACGIPILVGNQDGSHEAVIDGYNGYVVDTFDLEGQEKVLMTLGADAELRARLGRGACERAALEFAYPKFLEKHARFLASWFPEHLGENCLGSTSSSSEPTG